MNKNIDLEGKNTLEIIAAADNFNKWMYDTIEKNCSGKILEIGCGIGNISQFFINKGHNIHCSDLRKNYTDTISAKYPKTTVFQMDLTDVDFDKKFNLHFEKYDTVFALNVIEHIENHELAIKNCRKLLNNGGKLIILVPAYNFLFCEFDKNLGHFRRYNSNSLEKLMKSSNFSFVKTSYFNFAGILGWFFTGKILKRKQIPEGQMGLYNKLVPLFKITDRIMMNKIGLSVIATGTK